MSKPCWITKEECLAFHNELIARFGGHGGIRDVGLLDSALARPQQLFHYEKPTLVELAASYAAGIMGNHPFHDGNKRTGLMAAALFLETNGFVFQASEEEAVVYTLALAAGEIRAAEYAAWLDRSIEPVNR